MLVNKRKNAVSWDVSTSDIHNTFNKQKKKTSITISKVNTRTRRISPAENIEMNITYLELARCEDENIVFDRNCEMSHEV